MATGIPAFIQSKIRSTGSSEHGNFELLTLEGNQLVHYWRDNSKSDFRWYRAAVVSTQATGSAWIIQNEAGEGNFEVVVLEGSDLVHYWRDNSKANAAWNHGEVISSQATGQACLLQSDFRFGSKEHGNMELVVLEGNQIVHYWHDSSKPTSRWNRGEVISTQATGPACLIQSDFRPGSGEHGNMELVVLEGSNLVHYSHDSSQPTSP
jgi:hypothetical protein